MSPAIMFTTEVLPAPDRPNRAVTPGPASKRTPRRKAPRPASMSTDRAKAAYPPGNAPWEQPRAHQREHRQGDGDQREAHRGALPAPDPGPHRVAHVRTPVTTEQLECRPRTS